MGRGAATLACCLPPAAATRAVGPAVRPLPRSAASCVSLPSFHAARRRVAHPTPCGTCTSQPPERPKDARHNRPDARKPLPPRWRLLVSRSLARLKKGGVRSRKQVGAVPMKNVCGGRRDWGEGDELREEDAWEEWGQREGLAGRGAEAAAGFVRRRRMGIFSGNGRPVGLFILGVGPRRGVMGAGGGRPGAPPARLQGRQGFSGGPSGRAAADHSGGSAADRSALSGSGS